VTAPSGRLLRILVAALLTAYVLWRSDPPAVAQATAGADVAWILAAVALVLLDRLLMAQRWITLLCIVEGRRPATGRLMEIFFTSTFLGTFLPASIGGDAVRAYSLSREAVSGADAVASVFMDRMLGVASLLVLSVAGLWLARDLATNGAVLISLAATAGLCATTMLMIFSQRVGVWCAGIISLMPVAFLRKAAASIVESVQRYAHHHGALLNVLAASIGVQALRVIQAYCLGRAIGIEAGLAVYFAFIPLILLVMLLPITINGLGTSQVAFVWFFSRAGVPASQAFALSILFVLGLQIVGNLPGAFLYATRPSASGAAR
jgi:glycosyltransferase 2 family protein